MKNLSIFTILLISFLFTSFIFAQSNMQKGNEISALVSNSNFSDTEKFAVSEIKVYISDNCDEEDADFVLALLRRELIHSGKIYMSSLGDILEVKLFLEKKGDSIKGKKYGNVALAISSKNGKAAGAAKSFIDGYISSSNKIYYETLESLTKSAAGNFEYISSTKSYGWFQASILDSNYKLSVLVESYDGFYPVGDTVYVALINGQYIMLEKSNIKKAVVERIDKK